MLGCPNINTPAWRTLAEALGDGRALAEYVKRGDGTIPTLAELGLTSTTKGDELLDALEQIQSENDTINIDQKIIDAFVSVTSKKSILKKDLSDEDEQRLSRIIQFLKKPEQLGKVRTMSVFLKESHYMLERYLKSASQFAKEEGQIPQEKIAQLKYYLDFADSYDSTVKDLLAALVGVSSDNPVKKMVKDIAGFQGEIKALYNKEIVPLLSEVLSTGNELSNERYKEVTEKEIVRLRARVKELKGKDDAYAKRLDDRADILEKFIKENLPTRQLIEQTLKGENGDSSYISMMMEAAISNGDDVISSFAKFMKNKFHSLRERIIPIQNKLQSELEKFEKRTGRKRGNNAKFNEGLYTVVKRMEGGKEEKYISLLGEFTDEYILHQQKEFMKMAALRKEGKLEEAKKLDKELREWRQKWMEQPFTQEYYDAYKLLNDEAIEARGKIFNEISSLEAGTVTSGDLDRIDALWKDYKQLGYIYDVFGQPKTGKDLEIANSVRAYNEKRREMVTYKLSDKGRALFERLKSDKEDLLAAGRITQDEYDLWLRKNTTREIAQDWYDQRNELILRINAIASIIPSSGEEANLKTLWERMFAITNTSRDEDRIPDGNELTIEQLEEIRKINQDIEDIKSRIVGFSGLSKIERARMNTLYKKKSLSDVEQEEFNTLKEKRDNYKTSSPLTNKMQIELGTLFTQLMEMQRAETTGYYNRAFDEQYNLFRSEFIQTNPETPEVIIREAFTESPWYLANHYKQLKWVNYGDADGDWEEALVPTYAWKEILPSDPKHILLGQPSFKYKDRVVKDEYKNPDYKDTIDGYNAPKRVVDGKASPYINQEYEKLKSSTSEEGKAKFEYLDYLTNTYLKAQENIPLSQRKNLIIPSIHKPLIDRVQEGKVSPQFDRGTIKTLWEGAKNKLYKPNEQDADNGIVSLGDLAGHEFNYVKARFTGKIEVDNVSLNLAESITKFAFHAEKTKLLNESLPTARALQDTLASNPVVTNKLDAIANKLGINKKLKMRGTSTREKQVEEFINMIFFNEFEKEEILFGVSVSKITDNIMSMGALQMLALNVPAQVVNYISGYTQSFIEATAKQYMSPTNLKNGMTRYKFEYANLIKDSFKVGQKSLIGQMIDLYDAEQGKYESHLAHKSDFSVMKELSSVPYILKNAGEHEIAVSIMIAMMDAKILTKADGTKIKLLDAYELDKEGNIKLKDGIILSDQDKNDFNNQLHAIQRRTQGNYDKFNRPLVEKWSIGRLTTFMRKYVVPLAINRWGSKRFDNELGDMNEGFYRVFWRTFATDLVRLRGNIVKGWRDYSDFEKRAIMKTLTETSIILLLMLLSISLGYDDKKSYKDNSFLVNHLLYQTLKLKSETENFQPINGIQEIYRLVSTPTVALQSIKNMEKTIALIIPTITGDEDAFYKRQTGIWEPGDSKLVALLSGMVGFKGSTFKPETLIKNYTLSQKIR